MIVSDQHARCDRVDSSWAVLRMVELHTGIFALQYVHPLLQRTNDPTHLQFPLQRIRRCAQLT